MLGCATGGVGVLAQGYLFFTKNLPKIEKLKKYSPPIVSQFYADNGELIGEYAYERRFVVSIDDIPKQLQNAIVAAEDKNFWIHKGVDWEAIVRAIKVNITTGQWKEGASTITQQVAKTFLLTSEKKIIRKIREAILADRIEEALSKKQILHLYLNQIFLGRGYGVEAAARTFFGKHVKELTLAECAMLAGLPKAPSTYSPTKNLKKALERRKYVLGRMLEDNYITQAQYEQAHQEEVKLVKWVNPDKLIVPYFTEHVRRYIIKKYGENALYREGLQVYTTVDLTMTELAKRAIDHGLRELDKRQGYRGPLQTLNVKGVMEFLEKKTKEMKKPLRFGDITKGVITDIDDFNIYVRMGSYVNGDTKREYVGKIRVDPSPGWWIRRPYVRPDMRTRNFAEGDLPFQVGDLILVRLVDPNVRRKELYLQKYGKLDPKLKNYKPYTEKMLEYFPLVPEQEPRVEAALMLRENRTGYVRVLMGGAGFNKNEFNRATQARRQPGSAFKPVIYAAALNNGFTCADMILDTPLALSIPGTGEIWKPKNYGGGFQGRISFRQSLVKSKNVPTVKILQQIGIEPAKAYARKLGYTSRLANNLTMALGSTGVSLEEQTNAYSVFPNRGYLVPGVYVKRIVDRNGKIIEQHDPPVFLDDQMTADRPQIKRVSHSVSPQPSLGEKDFQEFGARLLRRSIDDGTAYIMTSLLQGVIEEGTAKNLKKIVDRHDIAGKTGTTNGNVDAWFMGFSPDYTAGVWVGFDDEFSLGDGETGGKAAAPIWGYFMKQVLSGIPTKEFPVSKAVEFRPIDPGTGLVTSAPGAFMEVFKTGSQSPETATRLVNGAPSNLPGYDQDQF
jgi:penicillin-binding protein 1A